MSDFGKLLYETKTDSNKNGIVFIVLGILLCFGANFIYAKALLMTFGVIIFLVGLYLLLFKRKDKISIFEEAIVLMIGGKELIIKKEEINEIGYQEVKARKSPVVSYYPILKLKDREQIVINKAFNSVMNKDFEKVIKSYI